MMITKTTKYFLLFLVSISLSCKKDNNLLNIEKEDKIAVLYYFDAHNNLNPLIRNNETTLLNSTLPSKHTDLVFIYSHFLENNFNKFNFAPTQSALVRVYKHNNTVIKDTIKVFNKDTISSSKNTLNLILNTVKSLYKFKELHLVYGSHSTGFMPANYYTPLKQMVRSIGSDTEVINNIKYTHEIDIKDFANAIPFTLNSIIFDCCLCSSIELMAELKGKVNKVVASSMEILEEGMNYKTMTGLLLSDNPNKLNSIAEDFYNLYNAKHGSYKSATISVIDVTQVDTVAKYTKLFFDKYRNEYNNSVVMPQTYSWHINYFVYDFLNSLQCANIQEFTPEQTTEFNKHISLIQQALNKCVLFEKHTNKFLNVVNIKLSCGLSCYVPKYGNDDINKYYVNLRWNKLTGTILKDK